MTTKTAVITIEFDYNGEFGIVEHLAHDVLSDIVENYATNLPVTAARVVEARVN